MLPTDELQQLLLELPLVRHIGPWSRVLGYHLLQGPPPSSRGNPQPLWPGGPFRDGARFTPKGEFGSIYLASEPVTALKEVAALFDDIGPIRTQPWVIFAVEGFLESVLDLTDPSVRKRLGVSLAELTGDWRFSQELYLTGDGPLPPTQLLGRIAYETGRFVAIKYPSAKNVREGCGYAVFADRLTSGQASFLEVYDPHRLIRQHLPSTS